MNRKGEKGLYELSRHHLVTRNLVLALVAHQDYETLKGMAFALSMARESSDADAKEGLQEAVDIIQVAINRIENQGLKVK